MNMEFLRTKVIEMIRLPFVKNLFFFFIFNLSFQLIISGAFNFQKLLIPTILYLAFASFLPSIISIFVVTLLEGTLLYINHTKNLLTNNQLSIVDIVDLKQAAAISSYADPTITFFFFLLIALIVSGGFIKRKFEWKLMILPLLFILSITTEYKTQDVHPLGINTILKKSIHKFYAWDWNRNIQKNGVFTHLLLTLDSMKVPKKEKHHFYEQFSSFKIVEDDIKPDIFMIMCESCFTTFDEKFKTSLYDLRDHGYQESIVLSPQYGGGTADVEFEALTGLPSENIKGVKYQLYADKFATTSITLPHFLKTQNYQTTALHNYFSYFWKRSTVYPLIGFDEDYFIEEMGWNKTDNWKPTDDLLYKKTLEHYQAAQGSSKDLFYFMITMFSHGSYDDHNNDLGESQYLSDLAHTTKDIIKFDQDLELLAAKRNKPVLIIIFGDHKPGLTELFLKKGVFSADDSDKVRKLKSAQVPAFVKVINPPKGIDLQKQIGQQINMKPVYCLPATMLDNLNMESPFFDSLSAACSFSQLQLTDGDWLKESFPLALYGENLFSEQKK